MPARVPMASVARTLMCCQLLTLAASCASARILTDPRRDNAYPESCDRTQANYNKHYDQLKTKLVRRIGAPGQLVPSATAQFLEFKGLWKLKDREFAEMQRPIGVLVVDRAHGVLPKAGRYCMTARWDPTRGPISDTTAWTVRFFDMDAKSLTNERALAYHRPDSADQEDDVKPRPRPAVRLAWLTRADLAVHAPGAAAPAALPQQQDDDGAFFAWYRCGAGCCGASLE